MIGLIAHVDTSPDAPGAGVEPIVHRDYDGGVIELPARGHRARSRRDARAARPGRPRHRHRQRRHAARRRRQGRAWRRSWRRSRTSPRIPSCRARRCASASPPTRRSAQGATLFDIERFGARCAYTIDGSELGELQDETFSAIEVDRHGRRRRRPPGLGDRQDRQRAAAGRADRRRAARRPADAGDDRRARGLHPPLRADRTRRRAPRSAASCATSTMTLLPGTSSCWRGSPARSSPRAARPAAVDVQPPVPEHAHVHRARPRRRRAAEEAMRAEGIEPLRTAIRGGTDGSRLSEMGLPTPNIFTGGARVPLGPRVGFGAGHGRCGGDDRASRRRLVRWASAAGRLQVRLGGMTDALQLASIDGEIMDAAEAVIPITDEGLIRGDGVFDVVRLYDGTPFALEDHWRGSDARRQPAPAHRPRGGARRRAPPARAGRSGAAARGPADHVTRGGRRLLITEQFPPHPPRPRLASITYQPTLVLDGVKSLSYAANMLAGADRARARLRRGAARHAGGQRAGAADGGDLLGRAAARS